MPKANMYFTDEAIEELHGDFLKTSFQYKEILLSYTWLQLNSAEAVEYKNQGFVTRFRVLKRCIDNIYRICPPKNLKPLDSDLLYDLMINLHSFIFNTFGCLDNLAWILVKEKNFDIKDPKKIGLGPANKELWKYLSSNFKEILERLRGWFDRLENFRHALAHRIPIQIANHVFTLQETQLRQKLEQNSQEARQQLDCNEAKKMDDEIDALGKFYPIMTHSFMEQSLQISFHEHVIQSWTAIVEIAENFLKELKN